MFRELQVGFSVVKAWGGVLGIGFLVNPSQHISSCWKRCFEFAALPLDKGCFLHSDGPCFYLQVQGFHFTRRGLYESFD